MSIRRLTSQFWIPRRFCTQTTLVMAHSRFKAREAELTAQAWNLVLRADPMAWGSLVA